MKFLAKLNRGAILTVLVLLAVVLYLLTLHFSQAAAVPEIKNTCRNYITTAVKYQMLPQKYRKDKPDMPAGELSDYISSMSTEIGAFYPDKERENAVDRIASNLTLQANGTGVVYGYTMAVSGFKSLDFHYDTVTVTVLCVSTYDGPYGEGINPPRTNMTGQTTDTFMLQKTDGRWQIIYADLQQPKNAATGGDTSSVQY